MPATPIDPLFTSVTRLPGVGEAVAAKLQKLDIRTLRDLLWHRPATTLDRRSTPPIPQAPHGEIMSAIVQVVEHRQPPPYKKLPYQVLCQNDTGTLSLTFFHAKGDYLLRQLPIGAWRIVSGTLERYHGITQMPHPDIIAPLEDKDRVLILEPVYPLTAGLTNRQTRKYIAAALDRLPTPPEWQDAAFIQQQHWPSWADAIRILHDPNREAAPALCRLAYDELLANQLALSLIRGQMQRRKGRVLTPGLASHRARAALPFSLTAGQESVLAEIERDLASGERMLRLFQGDVGSGKTVLALMAMLAAVDGGAQAALMAPTEIVARQHAEWIGRLVEPLGLRVAYLSGSEKGKSRREAEAATASGEAHIIIGTHALFQQSVTFHDLALIVVDEQHRFGVNQRLALAEKARPDGPAPHMLLMSATPIPRSLTLAWFGDLDNSRLTEKPPGRQPIDTRAIPMNRRDEVIEGLKRAIAGGARIYWVCPLVEGTTEDGEEESPLPLREGAGGGVSSTYSSHESGPVPTPPFAAAEQRFTEFSQIFPGRVGLAHGRIPAATRQETLAAFQRGELDLLVATTVIEVGVNVPEATIMVIEQAERFGLAQLHQLRGRVGRGQGKSSCILLYADNLTEYGVQRLKTLRDTEDGFRIAEEDLRLRGGGDMLGTRQSGLPEFRFADIFTHRDLLATAHDDARLILSRDPYLQSPRGQALRLLLRLHQYEQIAPYLQAG